MNILFISNLPFDPILGGVERVTDILTRYLVSRGHKVYHLISRFTVSTEYDSPATEVISFPEKGLLFSDENFRYYENVIKSRDIDIVINQRGVSMILDRFKDTDFPVKKVSVLHGQLDCEILENLSRMYKKPESGKTRDLIKYYIKKCISPVYRKIKTREIKKYLQAHYAATAERCDAMIVLAKSYAADMKNYISSNLDKVHAIPNPSPFGTVGSNFLEKEKTILYSGRLSKPDKDPIRLLKIWRRLYKHHTGWKLVIAGSGECLEEMKDYISAHALERVCFKGRQEDMVKYYRTASFVCLTSNFEGWPMCLIEGMSCGCIPVCFHSFSAAAELIDDGKDGFLIPPFDMKRYAKTLSSAMENPDLMKSMSEAAVRKSLEFSQERIGGMWEDLFKNL